MIDGQGCSIPCESVHIGESASVNNPHANHSSTSHDLEGPPAAAVEGLGQLDSATDTILLRLECMTARDLRVTTTWASCLQGLHIACQR